MSDHCKGWLVFSLLVLALGFVGWYENYVPVVPQPTVAQMMQQVDREVMVWAQQQAAYKP